MKHTRKKTEGMKRHMFMLPVLLVAVVAFILGASAPGVWADDDEIPFDDANIFFELNDTDGDLGIHALIDGEPWKWIKIEGPNERTLLWVTSQGRLRRQGLTELFFESAEPTFDELSPRRFFRRFPQGTYEIEGRTLEGDELESEVEVTHVMPAPPANIILNPDTEAEAAAEDCDTDPLPSVSAPVTISWGPVTMSHPDPEGGGAGVQPAIPVTVTKYQVVVEEEESGAVLSVDLPPGVTELEVPQDFTDLGDELKFEILVREESGNQTAVESCFEVE